MDAYIEAIKKRAAAMTLEAVKSGIAFCESQRFPTAAEFSGVPYADLLAELDRRVPPPDVLGNVKAEIEAGIPPQYVGAEFSDFVSGHADVLKRFAEGGRSLLFMHGKNGAGKTRAAYSLARDCIRRRCPWRIENVPKMLRTLRAGFGDGGNAEYRLEAEIRQAEFLGLDELGQQRATPYVVEILEILIGDRELWERPTVITSNLSLEEIGETLSMRIADRLAGGIVLHFTGTSRRWGQK